MKNVSNINGNIIITRNLTETDYSLKLKNTLDEKINRCNELKQIMSTKMKSSTDKNGLIVLRAAEEFNQLEEDIRLLRRSLYIQGFKDDTMSTQNLYVLRIPHDNGLPYNKVAQILAIQTNKIIFFHPRKQYYYYINDDNLLTDKIIESFERGFGDISTFFILITDEQKSDIYEVIIDQGQIENIRIINNIPYNEKLNKIFV